MMDIDQIRQDAVDEAAQTQITDQHERNSSGFHVEGFCKACADLHEALFSVTVRRALDAAVPLLVVGPVDCSDCGGDGRVEPPSDEVRAGLKSVWCPSCRGAGSLYYVRLGNEWKPADGQWKCGVLGWLSRPCRHSGWREGCGWRLVLEIPEHEGAG